METGQKLAIYAIFFYHRGHFCFQVYFLVGYLIKKPYLLAVYFGVSLSLCKDLLF